MDRILRARDRSVNQIKAIAKFTNGIVNETTLEALQTRLVECHERHKQFNDFELELLTNEKYVPITEEVDELYLNTIAKLNAAINIRSLQTKTEVHDLNITLGQFMGQQQSLLEDMHQTNNVRLPKVNIEPFDGDYKLWPSFHDLFKTSVHENKSINGVHKLQILKGLLRGDAAALIRHIKVTDVNYEEAWTKLVSRYNKPKSIVSSLIQLFLDQRSCIQANHRDLRKLYDTSDEIIRGLQALGEAAETRDPWLVHILVNKMDSDSRQLWARESMDDAFPTTQSFLKFLGNRCDALESCAPASKLSNNTPKHLKVYNITERGQWSCLACQKDHFVYKCPLFKSMNVENRAQIIASTNSCVNCLRSGHLEPQCYSRSMCLICKKRHHSLLHNNKQETTNYHTTNENVSYINTPSTQPASPLDQNCQLTEIKPSQSTSSMKVLTTSLHYHNQPPFNTLLPTALIYIQASSGQHMLVRALLDSGSQSTFITESCVQSLGLRRQHSHVSIYGLASSSAGKTRGKTVLTVKSRVTQHYTINITAHIIEKISSHLPAEMITIPSDNKIWELNLADPEFYKPRPVDLLIGAEYFLELLSEQKLSIPNLPVLHSSKLGWIIAGNISQDELNQSHLQNYHVTQNLAVTNESLMEQLKAFWKIEERFNNPTTMQLNADDPWEKLYRETTTRSPEGRFIVKLPFIMPMQNLGNSLNNARNRLLGIEKRFRKFDNYSQEYKQFMNDYIQLKQMVPIAWDKLPKEDHQKYFMPHHAVQKESTTTNFRVVFDASCKTTTAISLNDCLHIGNKLQPDLTTTLLRFRQNIIAINADIAKMYRQILVDEVDANFQLILWRGTPEKEIGVYKCNTVTYGTACAPFLAIRCLEELAKIYESKYPDAAYHIRNNFYMDDLLTGSNTEEGAVILKNQINEILNSAGFTLRKWKSNSSMFLKSLKHKDNLEDLPKLIENDSNTKTLGIMWYPQRDIFTFKLNTICDEIIWTKRKMLSESSKLYDPLGWLSPIVVRFKMLLQKLWVTKTEWDEEAPVSIVSVWKNIYSNLHYLQHIEIPRCLFISSNPSSIQLHAFCDASETAYGAAVYIRSVYSSGEIISRLVCSKSKVAPIKNLSLPRLELSGAVLLADFLTAGGIDFDRLRSMLIYGSDYPAYSSPCH